MFLLLLGSILCCVEKSVEHVKLARAAMSSNSALHIAQECMGDSFTCHNALLIKVPDSFQVAIINNALNQMCKTKSSFINLDLFSLRSHAFNENGNLTLLELSEIQANGFVNVSLYENQNTLVYVQNHTLNIEMPLICDEDLINNFTQIIKNANCSQELNEIVNLAKLMAKKNILFQKCSSSFMDCKKQLDEFPSLECVKNSLAYLLQDVDLTEIDALDEFKQMLQFEVKCHDLQIDEAVPIFTEAALELAIKNVSHLGTCLSSYKNCKKVLQQFTTSKCLVSYMSKSLAVEVECNLSDIHVPNITKDSKIQDFKYVSLEGNAGYCVEERFMKLAYEINRAAETYIGPEIVNEQVRFNKILFLANIMRQMIQDQVHKVVAGMGSNHNLLDSIPFGFMDDYHFRGYLVCNISNEDIPNALRVSEMINVADQIYHYAHEPEECTMWATQATWTKYSLALSKISTCDNGTVNSSVGKQVPNLLKRVITEALNAYATQNDLFIGCIGDVEECKDVLLKHGFTDCQAEWLKDIQIDK